MAPGPACPLAPDMGWVAAAARENSPHFGSLSHELQLLASAHFRTAAAKESVQTFGTMSWRKVLRVYFGVIVIIKVVIQLGLGICV